MKAVLRFDNVDTYREGAFSDREPVTIGREPDNRVAMPLNVLSRHHAKVYFKEGDWYVEDLDSANGTFHRGKQLPPNVKTELANGDIVHFGTVAMSICFAEPAEPAAKGEVKVVEKVVEKIVVKEVIREVPVAKAFVMPKEIKGKPVPDYAPEDPAKPFRPGLSLPGDLAVPKAERVIRL